MRPLRWSAILLTLFLAFTQPFQAFAANEMDDELVLLQSGKVIQKLSLTDIRSKLEPTSTIVRDPFEDEEAAYLAFRFNVILTIFYGNGWQDWDELLFTSVEEKQYLVPIDRFKKHTSYLAFSKPDGKEFAHVDNLKKVGKTTLEPFYLIWENMQDIEISELEDEGWVTRIKSMELIRFPERFPNTAPKADASKQVRDGFVAFRKNCMACHTVNGEGDSEGLELNYPMSITEYFNPDYLEKWITDPKTMRFSTKMPKVNPDMRERDLVIKDIIVYLEAMAGDKRSPEKAAKGFTGLVPKSVPKYDSAPNPEMAKRVNLNKKKKKWKGYRAPKKKKPGTAKP